MLRIGIRNRIMVWSTVTMLIAGGCTVDVEREKQILMETDRAFSQLSAEQGKAAAFTAFMTDQTVIYQNGAMPFEGRDAIGTMLEAGSGGRLTWEPLFAEVSTSGDLGYTLGKWTFTATDYQGQELSNRGRYVTIWKKQADGTWKFVFDSGIQTPEE